MPVPVTEYLEYAVRATTLAWASVHAHLDRYVVSTYMQNVSVFDTVSLTSRAFYLPVYGATSGPGAIVSHGSRLLIVHHMEVQELNLSDGTVDIFPTGSSGSTSGGVAKVVGNRLWFSSSNKSWHMDLTTMGTTTSIGGVPCLVADGVVYMNAYRYDASTGALISSSEPPVTGIPASKYEVIGGVVHYASSGTIFRTVPASASSLPSVPSAAAGELHLGSDGLLWSANNTTIRAYNPASGAVRSESWPTTRTERIGIVEAGGKMWAPSGQPLSH